MLNDKDYWNEYYKTHRVNKDSSTFAKYIINKLLPNKRLIDLGCGNARDSIYFAQHNIEVLGIDYADDEIKYLNENFSKDNLKFIVQDMGAMGDLGKFDYIYSRFSLHAISKMAEESLLNWISNSLLIGGLFFLEVRSQKDTMFKQGKKISDTENITDHYRRYSDFEEIKEKIINIGLEILEDVESNNLSIVGDDNPVLIRIIAKKKNL
jgi:tellurite methyltransferase